MESTETKKVSLFSFPKNFWTVIIMEFFERGSYYGVRSILSVYLVLAVADGGLGFSKSSVGVITSTFQPMLYLLPIVAGAMADRFGYRKTLVFAFFVMSLGYLLTSMMTSYSMVFAALILMVVGAGTFKPIISGTIARVTDKTNSTLAFGIYYWTINLGAFLFPLILVPILKQYSYSYVFIMAAVGTGWLLILNFLGYKEPIKLDKSVAQKKIISILASAFELLYSPILILYFLLEKGIKEKFIVTAFITIIINLLIILLNPTILLLEFFIALLLFILFLRFKHHSYKLLLYYYSSLILLLLSLFVFFNFDFQEVFGYTVIFLVLNFLIWFIDLKEKQNYYPHSKFILMIVIYSGFWILYFQQFDSVLWYFKDYVDKTPINNAVNGILGLFMTNPNWQFDVEHVTVINAGTIILLQIFVSNIVKNKKALPTMITGIAIGTIGIAILAISTHPFVFIAGIFIFSVGEMTAHCFFISYVGLIAPEDKKAVYLGYSFLYGVLGSGIGGILGANLYVHFVDNLKNPTMLWVIFAMIGVATIIGLLLFNKYLAPKHVDA